jgi:ADP-ribosyl-[dinitrogen reductase] hydrolase
MLVEIAIGDAYGAPFEFSSAEFTDKYNTLKEYVKSHRKDSVDNKGIGQYTDDTQMSIAIAEHMLDDSIPTAEYYIKYFKKSYKRDPIGGYSKRIKSALESKDYNTFLELNGNYSSNGSVMRCIPLGLYTDINTVIHRTIAQASASHCSPFSIDGSCVISLTAHYFYYEIGPKKHLITWLAKILGKYKILQIYNSWQKESEVSCDAYQTTCAVLKSLHASDSMKKILKGSINFTGDVDSVAALTMGLASLSSEISNDLPKFLYDNLRNDKYGKSYLEELDNKLFSKFTKIKDVEKESLF